MPEHKIGTREDWQAARDELAKLEAERQRAMAPFVEAERSGLYVGRELDIPTV